MLNELDDELRKYDGTLIRTAIEYVAMTDLKLPLPEMSYQQFLAISVVKEERQKFDSEQKNS